MKYYSELLNKTYDTVKDLDNAEAEFTAVQETKTKKSEKKKADAKVVEEAYANTITVRKEASKLIREANAKANEMISEANTKYKEELSKFLDKYPEGFHMTYRDTDGITSSEYVSTMLKSVDELFNSFFR